MPGTATLWEVLLGITKLPIRAFFIWGVMSGGGLLDIASTQSLLEEVMRKVT